MKVIPLQDRSEIAAAFNLLRRRWMAGATPFRRNIGWPGDNVDGFVHWRATDGVWLHFNASVIENRYWCCYGVQDHTHQDTLDITVEINPPRQDFDRRIGGAFVAEPGGRVFLAQSGKIGGGRKGVGKDAFWNFYLGPTSATVSWPDGEDTDTMLIGELRDHRLPQQIAAFVHEVARFKNAVASGSVAQPPARQPTFSAEFEGTKVFKVKNVIESSCDHGPVVRALKEALEALGLNAANDRSRDLYTLRSNREMNTLFEIKTSIDPMELYCGVGQLIIHGAMQGKPPNRMLVLPKGLGKKRRGLLTLLGIAVLEYSWRAKKPMFPGIKSVLSSE